MSLILVVAGSVSLLGRHFLHRSTPPPSTQENSGYIDPATCIACHQDVAESFSHTGMAHSISKPVPSKMVEDFSGDTPLFHQPSGNYYSMLRRFDGYYVRRYQIGYDGKETNTLEERIDYVIGSGDHARSYLHHDKEGRLIELPVTWYSERGGYWAMTPGYDGRDQKDLHGVVSKECIFCHDAYPQKGSEAVEVSDEPIFSSDLPQGIDCQRCHGPGAQHERAASAKPMDESLVRSSIVNPAHLSRERQLEVCMECHLSTSGSQDKNISLRPGRDVFSYRPGEPLGDYKLYFDSASPADKQAFPIADAAYRLRISACFRNSGMTCLTCHDPHDQLHGSEATQHYIEACEGCHRSVKHTVALPAAENCLTCHMPKRRGEIAVHTILTDHYIQRNKPARDLLAPIAPKSEASSELSENLALYYPAILPDDARSRLDLDLGTIESHTDTPAVITRLENDLKKYAPPQANYYAELGRRYASAGNVREAINWFQSATDRNPQSHDIAGELAEVSSASGDLSRAQRSLESIRSNSTPDARLLTNLANIYAQEGNSARAEVTLRHSLAIEPELAQTYNLLGMIKDRSGDFTSAEALYREAVRYRPDLPDARCNLAKLLIANNQYDEAGFQLRRAITAAPYYAEAHHDLALVLLLQRSYAAAEAELRAAIADDPENALSHSDLGDLLARMSRTGEALEQYRQALHVKPELAEANLGLGLLLRKEGRIAESKEYCDRATSAEDTSIRQEAIACVQQ